ncbi:hypothetical protein [Rhizobium leguminosarum]|uniref:GIY-YIG nuclease family protein n=1 Tax=Rhizobium leguminosarum TaxID=384 RepID=A0A7X0DRT6_RHILE|nr:hypothetical protein [Rhizobium leguminosarum]MBB6220690.1 hypothetical protein [Rhizobium leguminosarum]
MLLNGPERYSLSYTSKSFSVLCNKGTSKFSGLAVSRNPKLYIASVDRDPIYVGITKQKMQARLRYGWSARGAHGYHGYAWRHSGDTAALDVWEHADAVNRSERDIETIEAEVVYLIRQRGQWPAFQTEIHFYPSNEEHRALARQIFDHYHPS